MGTITWWKKWDPAEAKDVDDWPAGLFYHAEVRVLLRGGEHIDGETGDFIWDLIPEHKSQEIVAYWPTTLPTPSEKDGT